mgnify:CR=1 FL=1
MNADTDRPNIEREREEAKDGKEQIDMGQNQPVELLT